jgi:ABC-2 type transport system permease protein
MTVTAVTAPPRRLPSGAGQVGTLLVHTLVGRWRSLTVWGLGLVGMCVVQLAVYPSVRRSGESMQAFVDQWPEAFREAFGLDAYSTGPGFLNAEMFSMMLPLILIAVALSAAAAATAGEEERGTADLLLSLPTTRARVLTAKALAIVASVLVLTLAGWVTLVIGAPLVELEVAGADLAAGLFMAGLLGLLYAALGLLLGALTGRRAVVLGAGIGAAIAAFLLDALAPLADWLEPWQGASPFSWALGNDPLIAGVDLPMAGLLVGVTILFAILAALAYRRRDIASR